MNNVTVNVKALHDVEAYIRAEMTGGYQRGVYLEWRFFVYAKWEEASKFKNLYQQLAWNIH